MRGQLEWSVSKLLVGGQSMSQVTELDASLYKKTCFLLDNLEVLDPCQDATKT